MSVLGGRRGVEENPFSKIVLAGAAAEGSLSKEDLERLADEFLVGKANFKDLLKAGYDYRME